MRRGAMLALEGKCHDTMSIEIGNSTYYLTNATYNNDSLWGEQFKCVSVKEKSKDQEKKSTEVEIHYMNKDHKTLQTSQEKVFAIYMYNYTNTRNGIKYEVVGNEELTFEDALVFSDGESCDIFYAPYAVNAVGRTVGGYELWVSEEKVDNISPCCLFMYQYLAGKRRTYHIYTEDCKSKTDATESPAAAT
ncbi:male-specific histamine-binding salivary protein-like [Dermacentor andersoni]|uniref:male-specific histamine-binding salivary protein-like n=1 Tax=Dermacentor andersoni TaxID=34620 RepID=UPI00241687B5|nr:male-specific histamine-binding salivary protein-like [Dermacentor andersoni]